MLKLENISYYTIENGEKKYILRDINLSFDYGKFYAITGPNGSGKTTLAKIIMGIIKPSAGRVFLDDIDITEKDVDQRANLGVSYAFQTPVTFKGLKVSDLMNIVCKEKNIAKLCEYLSSVGLCAREYINRKVDKNLSGGELKRIELAMVLAKNGKINIFDEPEAGIDLWSFEKLTQVFSSLSSASNIIISHQKKVLEICDKVIILKNGKVDKQGNFCDLKHEVCNDSCAKLRGDDERN